MNEPPKVNNFFFSMYFVILHTSLAHPVSMASVLLPENAKETFYSPQVLLLTRQPWALTKNILL